MAWTSLKDWNLHAVGKHMNLNWNLTASESERSEAVINLFPVRLRLLTGWLGFGSWSPQADTKTLRGLISFSLLLRSFIPCAERIHLAVSDMAALFPKVRGAMHAPCLLSLMLLIAGVWRLFSSYSFWDNGLVPFVNIPRSAHVFRFLIGLSGGQY